MTYKHPYERLAKYFSMINIASNTNEIINIRTIHTSTNIPLKIVRNDIAEIIDWQFHASDISESEINTIISFIYDDETDDETKENKDTSTWPLKKKSPSEIELEENTDHKLLISKILDGYYDDTQLTNISIKSYRCDTNISIPVSPQAIEALAYLKEKESKLSKVYSQYKNRYVNDYLIKDSFKYSHWADYPLKTALDDINLAITDNKPLDIEYVKTNGEYHTISILPAKITYDSQDNIYQIIYVEGKHINSIRIDRIKSISPSKKEIPSYDSSIITQKAPNVWGNAFNDEPIKVKVIFYNEANVWQKVHQDLKCRTNKTLYITEKKYPVTGRDNKVTWQSFLVYEDVVIGKNKFKSWLRSYGSCAIVISPKELRDEMIASYQQTKSSFQAIP